jgi:hypothetical protein
MQPPYIIVKLVKLGNGKKYMKKLVQNMVKEILLKLKYLKMRYHGLLIKNKQLPIHLKRLEKHIPHSTLL